LWFAENIFNDINQAKKDSVEITEYLASFWNPESVRKIQSDRKDKEDRKNTSEDEFISLNKELTNQNDTLINAIRKIRADNLEKNKGENTINLNKLIMDTL
jgi:hypothetical protein